MIIIKYISDENTISAKLSAAVDSGCFQTMRRLGELGKAIKVFSVTFLRFGEDLVPGPHFKVCFRDSLGTRHFYVRDYRYIGSGNPNPTAREIADALCEKDALPWAITKHLKKCEAEKAINKEIIKATEKGLMD